MSAKFELKKATNGKFMFNLKAGNNEIILTSQLYETKTGAEKGIAAVKENASLAERYQRRTGAEDKPHFVLRAANEEVIGRSETYNSEAALEKGIASVKKNAPDAPVSDHTLAEQAAHAHAGKRG